MQGVQRVAREKRPRNRGELVAVLRGEVERVEGVLGVGREGEGVEVGGEDGGGKGVGDG